MSDKTEDILSILRENKSIINKTIVSLIKNGFDSNETLNALDLELDLPQMTDISSQQKTELRKVFNKHNFGFKTNAILYSFKKGLEKGCNCVFQSNEETNSSIDYSFDSNSVRNSITESIGEESDEWISENETQISLNTNSELTEEIDSNKIEKYKKRENKTYVCLFNSCGKRFRDNNAIIFHIQRHLNIKPFKCQYIGCDYRTVTPYELKSHKTKNHLKDSNERSKRSSKRRQILSKMESIEESDEWVSANETQLTLNTKNELTEEIDSNEIKKYKKRENKTYICLFNSCGKQFRNNSNINVHIRRHLNIRPFKCEYIGCGYRSFTEYQLISHKTKIHLKDSNERFKRRQILSKQKSKDYSRSMTSKKNKKD